MLKDIAGKKPADRLMEQIGYEMRSKHIEPLTRKQVSVVLHALADHTAIMEMVNHDRRSKFHPEEEETLWPTETSIGRWFHAVGDQLDPFPFAEEEDHATG